MRLKYILGPDWKDLPKETRCEIEELENMAAEDVEPRLLVDGYDAECIPVDELEEEFERDESNERVVNIDPELAEFIRKTNESEFAKKVSHVIDTALPDDKDFLKYPVSTPQTLQLFWCLFHKMGGTCGIEFKKGMTYEQALSVLAPQGLVCAKASKYNDGTHVPDTVAETFPLAGQPITQGDTVQVILWSDATDETTDAEDESTAEIVTDENGRQVIGAN